MPAQDRRSGESQGAPASRPIPAAGKQTALGGDRVGLPADLTGIVHILTCGSVDDGKSTLIGRLLWDAADLPDDTRANLQRSAARPSTNRLKSGVPAAVLGARSTAWR